MRLRFVRSLLLCAFLGTSISKSGAAGEWSPCLWNQESCFRATSDNWEAIVSANRARLVYFGTKDEKHNLLYPPAPFDFASASDWGGHRFWLGPQWKWNPIWPAPSDWERSAADHIEMDGATLTVTCPHQATGSPQLSRSYTWRNGNLHVKGFWRADSYQAIHIFQVPATAEIEADSGISPALPKGFGILLAGSSAPPETEFPTLPAVLKTAGTGLLSIHYRGVEAKLGFGPGTLTISEGDYGFRLERGKAVGRVTGKPDGGLLTQVYTGDLTNTYMEAEQLSALLATSGKPNSFEVILKPFIRPKP